MSAIFARRVWRSRFGYEPRRHLSICFSIGRGSLLYPNIVDGTTVVRIGIRGAIAHIEVARACIVAIVSIAESEKAANTGASRVLPAFIAEGGAKIQLFRDTTSQRSNFLISRKLEQPLPGFAQPLILRGRGRSYRRGGVLWLRRSLLPAQARRCTLMPAIRAPFSSLLLLRRRHHRSSQRHPRGHCPHGGSPSLQSRQCQHGREREGREHRKLHGR